MDYLNRVFVRLVAHSALNDHVSKARMTQLQTKTIPRT